MPRVSVLMPTYNNGRFLGEAVESIRLQSFSDLEFIIVDDASTDGSRHLLEAHAREDPRIRVLRNDRNRGIVHSLNKGLSVCRGDYVARMDGDDIALPARIERQIAVLDENPGIVVLGGAISYIDGKGHDMGIVRRSGVKRSLLARNPLLHPTVIFRRDVLVRHGLAYGERYRYAEDYYLWLQMSRLGSLDAVGDLVLKYRLTRETTRMRHLKGVLWATLKVKAAGVFQLGIRPEPADLVRFLAEGMLMFLPSSLVKALYFKWALGRSKGGLT
jgi:glycosyltransferase involved in cell wall biosynthesis